MGVLIDPVEAISETVLALCCKVPSGEKIWIPKCAIDSDSEVNEPGDYGTLIIPEWLAEREGLI